MQKRETIGKTTVYSVAKWVLERIDVNQYGISLTFKQTNSKERYSGSLQVRQANFRDMVATVSGRTVKVYDNYKTAIAEVKRLSEAEREKRERAGDHG